MSGTGNHDELALLIASFVEEVKPFFAGIRRGVAGIFAVPRDAQAIAAARSSLTTIASSATVLDLPTGHQLTELAQLTDQAFGAAERGGVPDESRQPLLALIDALEAQLDGLLTGDDRGSERLDNGRHLLEQVLQTVERAESAPLPALEIDLEDLLLTLAPAEPDAETPEEPDAVAPEAEPPVTQTELVLVAEDDVAPIEWGRKEALAWEKGAWDERKATFGNTDILFIDTDETGPLVLPADHPDLAEFLDDPKAWADEARAAATAQEAALAFTTQETDTAPPAASGHSADATPDPVEAVDQHAASETWDAAAVADPAPVAGESASPLLTIDAGMLEEATLLSLSADDLTAFLALDEARQEASLDVRLREMAAFAVSIGIVVEPPVAARFATPVADAPPPAAVAPAGTPPTVETSTPETARDALAEVTVVPEAEDVAPVSDSSWSSEERESGDLSAAVAPAPEWVEVESGDEQLPRIMPVEIAAQGDSEATAAAGEVVPAAEAAPTSQPASEPQLAASLPEALAGEETISPGSITALDAMVDYAPVERTPEQGEAPGQATDEPAAEAELAPAAVELATDDAGREDVAENDWDDEHSTGDLVVAAIADVLIGEYRAVMAQEQDPTSMLEMSDADAIMAARLYSNRLNLPGHDAPETGSGDGAGVGDDLSGEMADEPYESLLDTLLEEDTPARGAQLSGATDAADNQDDVASDPNFAALPDVPAEIEAAFATLSEADMMTFLTLDGDEALTFLQGRIAGGQPAEDVVPIAQPVVEPAQADMAQALPERDAPEDYENSPSVTTTDSTIDPEILEVFLLEMQELLDAWGTAQARLRLAPADTGAIDDLRRTAHTLKGAANMMGFSAIGEIGRQVEATLDVLGEQDLVATPIVIDFVEQSYTVLQQLSADTGSAAQAQPGELATLTALHEALLADLATIDDQGAPPMPVPVAAIEFPATPDSQPAELEAAFAESDSELMEIFIQEAEEHLGGFNRALVNLDRHPGDKSQLAEAKRLVHTLKGAAAALGYPTVAALCHSIEDLFETLDQSGRDPSREMITLFFESVETLEGLIAGIAAGRGEHADAADALRARYAALLGRDGGARDAASAMPELPEQEIEEVVQNLGRAATAHSVRVDIAHLDNLLNVVGELVINRTGQEQHLERLGRTVNELLLSVERLRRIGFDLESRYEVAELLRASRHQRSVLPPSLGPGGAHEEFDDLEMDRYTEFHRISRELIEVAADISTAGSELETLYDGFDQSLMRQGRIATDLQDRLMEVRLVPLSSIASRLYRAVRGVAVKRGRDVELVIEGETTEIDKLVLEELTDPLLHLVRNAADHGVEDPDARRERGKPRVGTVRVSASREGNEAVISISDDGAGIDIDAVLDKAVERGHIRSRDQLTREQALDLIFMPGFSTSATVSDISGRGVGMDVVRTNVARLKGTIDVSSTLGAGTVFTIRLPIMLAVTRALLIRVGVQTFAIPLPVVEQVAFYREDQVKTLANTELFDLGGQAYPVIHLAKALGIPGGGAETNIPRVLIVGNAERKIALVVDELVGQQEVVVKRLGHHLQSVVGVAGATILGNGQIILILNILDLLGSSRRAAVAPPVAGRQESVREGTEDSPAQAESADERQPATAAALPAPPQPFPGASERLAMVVDDSLSVRRVLTRTLERDGWKVLQAKDGVEALEMLTWARPRVMLLDIEMPRMDGYEFTTRLKGYAEYRDLPILMLTSRAGEKHRRKAFDLGVSAYLVKPFEEVELLRTVRELAGVGSQRVVVGQ